MKQRATLTAVITTVLLFVTLTATPANADNFAGATGKTDCVSVNMTDNATLTYINIELDSRTVSALSYTYKQLSDKTNIVPTKVTSITSKTDQINRDQYYTDYCGHTWMNNNRQGVVGLMKCNSLSGKKCQSATVRFNKYYTDDATVTRLRNLATHETGHVLGLTHVNNTSHLMYKNVNNTTTFSAHDLTHLNTIY